MSGAWVAGMLALLGACAQPGDRDTAPEGAPERPTQQALSLTGVQVKDINTRPVRFPSLQSGAVALPDGTSLLAASDGLSGEELWRSNGSETGSSLVKDIAPGLASSIPRFLTKVGGTVFFAARSEGASDFAVEELWKTDGTPAGTVRVKRLPKAGESDQIAAVVQANGTVYFIYDHGYVAQLWQSDGTEAGTVPVQNLALPYEDLQLLAVGNTVFFTTRDAQRRGELWKLAEAGPQRLLTFTRSPFSHAPELLAGVGNTLFLAVDKTLWRSDGTLGGTTAVTTLSTRISEMVAFNGSLFFVGAPGLWKSDGTSASLVHTFEGKVGPFATLDGALVFAGTTASFGTELWTSDGTAAGTHLLKDLVPGPEGSALQELTVWNGGLYFTASTSLDNRSLWRSDGTAAGTLALKAWAETEDFFSAKPHHLTPVGSALLFSVPEFPEDRFPHLTWRTVGTAKGTREMAGAWAGTRPSQTRPQPLGTVGASVYFAASDGTPGETLWRSDGSPTGTVPLRTFAQLGSGQRSWSEPRDAVRVGEALFFKADDGAHGFELWKSDGTGFGTVLVKDIEPGPASSSLGDFAEWNGVLFFTADDSLTGPALWRSDGTGVGTFPVKAGDFNDLTVMNGTLYLSAPSGTSGAALWKSDGTPEGTVLVKAPIEGAYSYFSNLVNVDGTLFFSVGDGEGDVQLWKSDGTAGGTVPVQTGFECIESLYPQSLNGVLFFIGCDATHGYELWRSDGTTAGTMLLKDIQPGPGNSLPHALTRVGPALLFVAYDEAHGLELWRTDGTQAGTQLLVEMVPGVGNGILFTEDHPFSLMGMEDRQRAVFAGTEGTGGVELWQTDGTLAGTFRRAEIAAGATSSSPNAFTLLGDRLFFMAGDAAHGREPRFLAFPRELGTATGTAVAEGSTCTALPQVTPSCTYNALAPDASFSWTAPASGTFVFTTEGSGYDTSLELSDPTSGGSLGCNDDTQDSLQSSVTRTVSAGQTLLITIDGYDAECGPFRLGIRRLP
ncbi:ELWxxDGT repeat-containing protein [Stigmatella aurantiaca]|uniref:ELWxxDGT repeat-containing protein n=1 Tax=Stigmatella aurantiaca TaxID=41 RepID=A0A1H7Y7G3_STIAU|nr:ELWxxDGT repeat protein [Stigmatella aurantiaca]SEM41814.1 ELWxxDGT repeat-containing protein [Stigmatella aurantiaca]